jgi:hypothetical protein
MRKWMFGLVPLAVLAACTDLPNAPSSTPPASDPSAARGGAPGSNQKTSLDLIEDDVANGAVDKQNANIYREAALSDPSKLPAKYRSTAIGKDATSSLLQMAKDWSSLSKSTQQQILDLRAKGLGNLSESIQTQHFVLHYTTIGNHSVPLLDANRNSIPDYIDVAAQSLETVWHREIDQLGYPAPRGTPAQKFHVYYKDLSSYYGATYAENVTLETTTPVPLGTATAFIVVENDFAEGFPPNDEDVTGQEVIRSGALKVTQAHEFMHAIQNNINLFTDLWLAESHATWAEDAVYDGINDWHWYINRFLATPDLPLFSRFVYGAAFFQNWLSETYGADIQRRIWMAAKTNTTRDAIRLTAFGGSFEPLRDFAPTQYTLGISDFTSDPTSVIPLPTRLPVTTHTSYPVAVSILPSTNKLPNEGPWGYGGANFIEFVPAGSGTLDLTFDGTDGFAWRAVAVATPKAGGSPSILPISLNGASAGSLSISGFGTRWAKVTLVPTIVGTTGVEVPYSYGATVN